MLSKIITKPHLDRLLNGTHLEAILPPSNAGAGEAICGYRRGTGRGSLASCTPPANLLTLGQMFVG